MRKFLHFVFAACLISALCIFATAQAGKKNTRPVKTAPVPSQGSISPANDPPKANEEPIPEATPDRNVKTNRRSESKPVQTKEDSIVPTYFYEFSRPGFIVSQIWIEHDGTGKGKITFKKGEFDEAISDPINVSQVGLDRINAALTALDFVNSTDNYQYEKDYSHLGNVTIRIKKEGHERTAKFNWTENKDAKALADEYRKISNQYLWMFDINLDRENQPLDAPRQMDALDSLLQRGEVSDPKQLVPFLKELSNDERIPLIARNHATRLITQIEKVKK
jgi:hypothetical protein